MQKTILPMSGFVRKINVTGEFGGFDYCWGGWKWKNRLRWCRGGWNVRAAFAKATEAECESRRRQGYGGWKWRLPESNLLSAVALAKAELNL